MNYKIGDKVLLYSWNELVNIYGVDSLGNIKLPNGYHWYKYEEHNLVQNRIITIDHFDKSNDPWYKNISGIWDYVYPNIIKCHANEHYLQQIKEEL